MTRYWKAIAALVSAVVLYVMNAHLGLSAAEMGVADEVRLLIDAVIVGGLVYIFPANTA